MHANPRVHAPRLTAGIALGCLLAGGIVGAWLAAERGPVAADAVAQQPGAKPLRAGKALPVVAVVTRYAGMTPHLMEAEITNRLERALRNAEGLHAIESRTVTGLSIVHVHFDDAVTPPVALAQAAGLVGTVVPHLPAGTARPEVSVVDQARPLPVCVLALDDAALSLAQQTELARRVILPELASLAGITARLGPASERVIAVTLDPAKLTAHALSARAVYTALNETTVRPSAGTMHIGDRQFLVQQRPLSLGDLRQLPIRNGPPSLYLHDVAHIEESLDLPMALGHVNGRRRVWVAVHARRGTRDATARQAVRKLLAGMRSRLARGVRLDLLTFGNAENPEAGVITLRVRAAAGTRLEVCQKRLAEVEQYLKKMIPPDDIDFALAQVGPDTSASAAWPLRAGPHEAAIRLQLTQPGETRKLIRKLRPLLREHFADMHVSVHAGSGMRWPIVVRIGGGPLEQCEKLAGQVRDRIAKLPEATDVQTAERLPALQIEVDAAKAAALGLTRADVQPELLAVGPGLRARLHVAPADAERGEQLPVILRLPERVIQSVQELGQIAVTSPRQGAPIPLNNLATIKIVDAPAEIDHWNLARVVTVRVNADDVDRLPLARAIEDNLSDLTLPAGTWLKVRTAP